MNNADSRDGDFGKRIGSCMKMHRRVEEPKEGQLCLKSPQLDRDLSHSVGQPGLFWATKCLVQLLAREAGA